MADYSIWVLGESQISITGGVSLDGITQGDGSHLVGEFITINTIAASEIFISDAGSETNFADNDSGQRLDGAQTVDGTTFADNTVIEAEYQIILRDDATGIEYTAIAVNINDSSPSYATVEAIAFIDTPPPAGVSLRVVSTSEGPSNGGPNVIDESRLVPICFCEGTAIQTNSGPRKVETLAPDDQVLRSDGTFATLRRIFCAKVAEDDLAKNPRLFPVRISAGTLGGGLPERDLLVSRQHRMLASSNIAQRMFGTDEVLISAIKLTALPGIFVDTGVTKVEYYHLLFDTHEIILAEGAPTESLFTGPEALKAVAPDARREIITLFPDIAENHYEAIPARLIPSGASQKKFVARHAKNEKPLRMT